MNNCGVYKLLFSNGKFYIGSSIRMKGRFSGHKLALRGKRHSNRYMQRLFNIFGEPEFEELLICLPKDRIMFEQICIDGFKPSLNLSKIAGDIELTEHVLSVRRNIWKGKKFSEEHIAALKAGRARNKSSPRKGMKNSIAHRKSISTALSGRKLSEETKRNISKGLKLSYKEGRR